jgi:lipopolysaccharide biosynthesis glycosyltransferase
MIFLMDFKADALARTFQRARRSVGLALDTPYFNAGLMAIDRVAWRAERITERVTRALAEEPERYPFMEQDALNATLAGAFAPLSPRFNFMGDFLLLDLERSIEPIVLHFVVPPKPWEAGYRGEPRFAAAYRDWFAASPWPDWARPAGEQQLRRGRPPMTPLRCKFAQGLTAFLEAAPFVDGPLRLGDKA